MEAALTAWFGQHDEGHIYIQSREALLELPRRERGLLVDQDEVRSPPGMDRQLDLLQRAHEVRLPVVPARETADRIHQLQLIVKDQDVHGSELRNPCAIPGCNADRHLQGTQLPKPVAATPIFVGASIPSAGRGLWSAAPNTVQGRPPLEPISFVAASSALRGVASAMTHPALIHGVRVHITRQPKEVLATWPVELPLQPGSRMRPCRPGSGASRRVACWPFSNPERPLNRRYARMDAPALPPSSMHSVLLNTCRTGAFSVPRSSSADRAYRNSLPKEGRYLRSHPDRSDLLRRQSARQHARGASPSRRRSA